MKFSLRRSFVLSTCQLLTFVSVFYLSGRIALLYHEPVHVGIVQHFAYHSLINISIGFFGFGVTFTNFLIAAVDKTIFFWSAYGILAFVYILFHAVNLDHTPYRSTHFILAGFLALVSVFPLNAMLTFAKKRLSQKEN